MSPEGMVHALQEAHRVLKPDGILIDLRPAAEHRQLGFGEGQHWRLVGRLHEVLDDDHAADTAIRRVIRQGYFRQEQRSQFLLDRVLDNVAETRAWIDDFDQRRDLPSHAVLLDRLDKRLRRLARPTKIAVRGHMTLGILRKLDMGTRPRKTRETK